MAEENFPVFEWKIENFSCWCESVHGKSIVSPIFFFSPFNKAELYPRGVSGLDDRMGVSFCTVKRDFINDLTVIGSDGSSIFSQKVTITQQGEKVTGTSVDLKFEDVVAQIRKADQKDQITLRFCIPNVNLRNNQQRMCTTIDVLKVSFKFDPKLIESFETNESVIMLFIPYTTKKDFEAISVRSSRENDIMKLTMRPNKKTEKAVFVEIFTYMLSSENASVKYEERKHVFIDGETWTFSESIKPKDLAGKGTILLFHLKIVNGFVIQRHNHLNYLKEVSIVPNNICFSDLKSSKSPVTSNQSEDSSTVLKNDFMSLYQDQDYSDFLLKCDNVSFPVHRPILSARSPVFKTMLSTDMKEAALSAVDITDLDAPTVARFLAFLYTGTVEEMHCESALKLYYAADKYQVLSLKRESVHFLRENVSVSNVCDILTLADKHKDDDLIAVSYDFILNNYNDVLGSKEWENLMEVEPFLAVKTVTHFAKKNYVKIHIPRA